MNPRIKPEALSAVEQYLETIKTATFDRYGFSSEETDVIFPAIVSLLNFGHRKYGSSSNPKGPGNHQWLSQKINGDPTAAREIAGDMNDHLMRLLNEYRHDEVAEIRDNLFKTPIGNMTGYQFEIYLREIGILNT